MERTYRCRVKNKMGKLFFCSCYLNSLFVKVILVDVFVLNINEQHQPTCVCIKIPINDWMTDLHNCMKRYCQHSQTRNSCEHIFFLNTFPNKSSTQNPMKLSKYNYRKWKFNETLFSSGLVFCLPTLYKITQCHYVNSCKTHKSARIVEIKIKSHWKIVDRFHYIDNSFSKIIID